VLRADNLFDADVRNHLSRLKSVMPEKGRNFSLLAKMEF
jgi:iron complex outermembrane receptor protein